MGSQNIAPKLPWSFGWRYRAGLQINIMCFKHTWKIILKCSDDNGWMAAFRDMANDSCSWQKPLWENLLHADRVKEGVSLENCLCSCSLHEVVFILGGIHFKVKLNSLQSFPRKFMKMKSVPNDKLVKPEIWSAEIPGTAQNTSKGLCQDGLQISFYYWTFSDKMWNPTFYLTRKG